MPQNQHIGRRFGAHRGGMGFSVDEAHFSNAVTGIQRGDDDFTSALIVRKHPRLAGKNHEQRT